jgi:uncharacterized membrane protein
LPDDCSPSDDCPLPFDLLFSEALRRAEERVDVMEAKLKSSEMARKKAEKEAAVVEGLRQRLKTAEDALNEKEAQQIKHENAIVDRFNTQNRRFTCKLFLRLSFCFCLYLFISDVDGLVFCSCRMDG